MIHQKLSRNSARYARCWGAIHPKATTIRPSAKVVAAPPWWGQEMRCAAYRYGVASGYDIVSLPWKNPPCYVARYIPSISIRAIYTMAMLVITRWYIVHKNDVTWNGTRIVSWNWDGKVPRFDLKTSATWSTISVPILGTLQKKNKKS
jgi:hypothetical protein